jgi:hypothetical protein
LRRNSINLPKIFFDMIFKTVAATVTLGCYSHPPKKISSRDYE